MEGIFTLPYSEFEVVNNFQKIFKRNEGYSIFVPVSRQEKAIDFLMMNTKQKTTSRFQVKSSRIYIDEVKKKKNGTQVFPKYRYHLWLNNFIEKYSEGLADFYIIFGLYPVYDTKKSIMSDFWKPVTLCFSDNEMKTLLDQVKTKKEQKQDRFFGFSFNEANQIFGTRGFLLETDASKYLMEEKIKSIKDFMNPKDKCID